MKKVILSFLFAFLFCIFLNSQTTVSPQSVMTQAALFVKQKEYAKARYSYTESYRLFLSQNNLPKAIECGVQAAVLYHRENNYKEAFDLCRVMEQNVLAQEKGGNSNLPHLRYKINKVRWQMFMALKRQAQAKQYLDILRSFANHPTASEEIKNDLLSTQANYFYGFGMNTQGDATLNTLIAKYRKQKNYSKVSECYTQLIAMAVKSNNAALVSYAYNKYILWTDSVKSLTATDKLSVMTRKYSVAQGTIGEKNHSLSVKNGIIIALSSAIALLLAGLILGAVVLMRYVLLCRKQKKNILLAHEQSELKTRFISNISAQMETALKTLDASHSGVKSLLTFSQHIQELSRIENSTSDDFSSSLVDVNSLVQSIVEKVQSSFSHQLTIRVDVPKMSITTYPEQLERILLHLLMNAAKYTPEDGKIWLEFKKRGAYTHQFVITDTGTGISPEMRENLFKPFATIKDLSQGDALGLPICALTAEKMNACLSLDKTYGRGSKFILELHSQK